ncbi:kinase-like domain-containing protein [Tricladium varicosporioides]|nr:kinase-like domain-containing protein [Hymenoscyphus varicosporioides]
MPTRLESKKSPEVLAATTIVTNLDLIAFEKGSSKVSRPHDFNDLNRPLGGGMEDCGQQNDEQIKFEPFYQFYSIDAENLVRYNDGAFLPVHLGDLYNGKYRVMLKIGYGSYSTVWLAVDLFTGRHVALKFLVANEENELDIHKYIQSNAHRSKDEGNNKDQYYGNHEPNSEPNHEPTRDGREYILPLLDSFKVGQKKEYTILVTPVLIPLYHLNEGHRLQIDMKTLLFQFLQGISFLHSKGITHGDLHPGNITLQVSTHLQDMDDIRLFAQPRIIPVVPSEDSAISSFNYYPKYLVSQARFEEYVKEELKPTDILLSAKIQIIDLSNSYQGRPTVSDIPTTHRRVRGPEFFANKVNGGGISDLGGTPSDVWSAACTMFAFVFGKRVELFENACALPEHILWEVERKIGPLLSTWQLPVLETPKLTGGFLDSAMVPDVFWEGLLEIYHGVWDKEVVRRFLGLIRRMLKVDPVMRPSINEVLMDEWFDDVRDIWGTKGFEWGERESRTVEQSEVDP